MHQHVLFTPTRPPTSAGTPALTAMRTQGTNLTHHIPKETPRVHSFTPVTTFHKTPQMSFRSPKRGTRGALHVRIAWHIYYQEKIKKRHGKCHILHQEVTSEHPVTSLPDMELHKEPVTPQNPDSPWRPTVHGCNNRTEVGTSAENLKQLKHHPPHPDTPSPPSHLRQIIKRPRLDWEKQPPKTDDEEHRLHPPDSSPPMEKTWMYWDRKRQRESISFSEVKRTKQEVSDDRILSSHNIPVQHITGDVSAFYSKNRWTAVQQPTPMRPAADMCSHPTALWEIQKKINLHRDNACNVMGMPCVDHRDREAFTGIPTLPLYFPPGLSQLERSYIRQRVFLQSHVDDSYLLYRRHPLPHHGFITPSYSGP